MLGRHIYLLSILTMYVTAQINWVSIPTSELVVWVGDMVRLDCSAYGDFANEPLEVKWSRSEIEGVANLEGVAKLADTEAKGGDGGVSTNVTVKEKTTESSDIESDTESFLSDLTSSKSSIGNIFPNGSLVIQSVDISTPGYYTCSVEYKGVTQTQTSELRMAYLSDFRLSPRSVEGYPDDSVSLECVTGPALPTPEIYWVRSSGRSQIGIQTNATFGEYGFAGSRQLTMKLELRVIDQVTDVYKCEAYNPQTGQSIFSQEATVSLIMRESAPVFTDDLPASVYFQEGFPLIIPCSAQGWPTPTIQWFFQSAAVDQSMVLPNGSLYINLTQSNDSGVYYCTANNSLGEAQSQNIQLLIAYMGLSFLEHPADLDAVTGQSVELSCKPPQSEPAANISWYKDHRLLDGENSQSLTFPSVQSSDSGSYYCLAHNAFVHPASVTSQTAKLRVYAYPVFESGGVISGESVVRVGEIISLSCIVNGDPTPQVTWLKDDIALTTGDRITFSEGGQRLYISNSEVTDSGSYLCQAVNDYGSVTTSPKQVTVVSRPVIFSRIGNLTLRVGEEVMLPCTYSAQPTPLVQWYKDGSPLTVSSDDRYTWIDNQGLTITDIRVTDTGLYRCLVTVTQTGDSVSDEGYISILSPPVITQFLVPQYLDEGEVMRIQCTGAGSPTPNVIINHKGLSYTSSSGELIVDINSTLDTAGDWECTVTNHQGSDTDSKSVIVNYSPRNTMIRGSTSIVLNQPLELRCESTALPVASYSWARDGVVIMQDPLRNVELPSPDHLIIQYADPSKHSGNYSCSAINRLGIDTEYVQVVIADVPDPPVDINLSSPSAGQIQVNWTTAPQEEYKPVIYYVIEYRRSSESNFRRHEASLSDLQRSYLLSGLTPGSLYLVRMLAGNAVGEGRYSAIYSITTLYSAPTAPQSVVVPSDLIGSDSVTIEWADPSHSTGSISYYQLQYRVSRAERVRREATQTDEWQLVDIHIALQGQATHSHKLGGLSPYTTYDMQLRAVISDTGQQVYGEFSDVLTFTTGIAAPEGAPYNLTIVSIGSQHVELYFILPQRINGPVRTIQLRYKKVTAGSDVRWSIVTYINVPDNTDTMTSTGLEPWTEYYFGVAFTNLLGMSWWSQTISGRTQAKAPDTPANFRVSHSTQTTVLIEWTALPLSDWHSDSVLGEYLIDYWHSQSVDTYTVSVLDSTSSSKLISGLEAWTVYWVWMRAVGRTQRNSTQALISEASAVLTFTTREQVPTQPSSLRVLMIAPSYVVVAWSPPTSPFRGRISGYNISATTQSSNAVVFDQIIAAPRTAANVTGLQPLTEYTISVICYNTEGSSTEATIHITTLEGGMVTMVRQTTTQAVSSSVTTQGKQTTQELTNQTTDIPTVGQSGISNGGLTKVELVAAIVMPIMGLCCILVVVSLTAWCRKKKQRAENMQYFMNKCTSQTGLVAEGADTLSAEWEKDNQSAGSVRYKGRRHSDVHMTDLNTIHISADMTDEAMYMAEAYSMSPAHYYSMKQGGELARSNSLPPSNVVVHRIKSPRRRLVENDYDLYHASDTEMGLASVPEHSLYDYRDDHRASSDSSGFDNPNYSSDSDDVTTSGSAQEVLMSPHNFLTSSQSVLMSSSGIPVFSVLPASYDTDKSSKIEEEGRANVRRSVIRSDVAEIIANQISRHKTSPSDQRMSSQESDDIDLHDKQLVYSRRTML